MRVDDDARAASLASPSVCGDVCGDVCEDEPQPRPVRRQRTLPLQTEGPAVVFLRLASSTGWSSDVRGLEMPPVHIEGDWSSDGVLVGAVLGRWLAVDDWRGECVGAGHDRRVEGQQGCQEIRFRGV